MYVAYCRKHLRAAKRTILWTQSGFPLGRNPDNNSFFTGRNRYDVWAAKWIVIVIWAAIWIRPDIILGVKTMCSYNSFFFLQVLVWCSLDEYNSFSKSDIESSLMELSNYLFKHFKHQCYLIVDEYNSICASSIVVMWPMNHFLPNWTIQP
jgi:hypothetical protein